MVDLLDVTLRDGLYVAEYLADEKRAYSIIKHLIQAEIKFIEVGYWNNKKERPGPSSCNIEYLRNLPENQNIYCVMLQEKQALSANFSELASTQVKMLRFSSMLSNIKIIEPCIYRAKEAGFKISVNLIRASEHSLEEIIKVAKIADSWGVDWIYIADSNGALISEQVYKIISSLRDNIMANIGFHAHNGLGFALSNALEAIKAGASLIDASICGIGKGSNLPTELIGMFLKTKFLSDIEIIPILNAAYEEIYPNEGAYILTQLENLCASILNYNLDNILFLKKHIDMSNKSFFMKLMDEIKKVHYYKNSNQKIGVENERLYKKA